MASKSELEFLRAQELFGKAFYEKLSATPGNVLFSPSIVHAILTVLVSYLNEDRKNAVLNILHLSEAGLAIEGYEKVLTYINSLTDVKLINNCKFLLPVGCQLKASVENICKHLDFKIERNDEDNLIIVSSLHLKSVWSKQFDTQDFGGDSPSKGCFQISDTQVAKVDMIFSLSTYKFKSDDHLDAVIIEIPFTNKNVSMLVILPNDPFGIHKLQSELEDFDLEELTDHLQYSFIEVSLPKFKLDVTTDVGAALKQMELGDIFNSSIVGESKPQALDRIISKVCLEIDEEGDISHETSRGGCCCQVISEVVKVDHPFILYVIAQTDSRYIIFQGKIVNPCP